MTLLSSRDAVPGIARLTRALAKGDETAFREFHRLYFDRLYQFLLIVTRGQVHAAQDAVQETMVRVVRHAREFQDEDVFWSWLKAIGRNAARDGGRKQRRYGTLLERFAFGRDDSPVTHVHTDNLRTALDESLSQLEGLDRELVEGKYVKGVTVVELAAQTGLSEKAVESRLLRLRRQLAESLLKKVNTP